MGSVKDLVVIKKPTVNKMGVARFIFSDRYSVFDWGEMPDLIDGKGTALCMMGAHCFERLEEKGIRTHYRGLVDKNGRVVSFDESDQPSNTMEIDLVNVYRPRIHSEDDRPRYDYSMFTTKLTNYLIPLEVIYRNGVPEGSSVFKRLEQRSTTIGELGLDHYPKPGERLKRPIFDVSTKLENSDRYVSWEQAKGMAGLTYGEVVEIRSLLSKVDETITTIASKAGLANEDGKIELAFDDLRRLMVVDVVGTLDECRFTYDGLYVSKEMARQHYRTTDWYKDVEEAKKKAETGKVEDWKALCKSQPPKLESRLKAIIRGIYLAASNELTGHKLFDVPSLAEIIGDYRSLTEEKT